MLIAVVYRPPAMTAQQYKDSWRSETEESPLPRGPGLVFRTGVGEGEDFFTVSVWESREAYDAFAPVFSRVTNDKGFRFGPLQILPVHHVLPSHNQ